MAVEKRFEREENKRLLLGVTNLNAQLFISLLRLNNVRGLGFSFFI